MLFMVRDLDEFDFEIDSLARSTSAEMGQSGGLGRLWHSIYNRICGAPEGIVGYELGAPVRGRAREGALPYFMSPFLAH